MNTKDFTFPTFEEWCIANFGKGYPQGDPLFHANHVRRRRHWYALDFLNSLADFVNEASMAHLTEELLKPKHFPNLNIWGMGYDREESPTSLLFRFSNLTQIQAFLYYEGCGTSSQKQLNILYNIDQ